MTSEARRHVAMHEVARDALTSLTRNLTRTLLCTVGTIVAVAAAVTTDGLSHSAQNAVTSSFNELRATTVEFQAGGTLLGPQGVSRLARLHGVVGAGLLWDVRSGQPLPVATTPHALSALVATGGEGTAGTGAAELSFTAATPQALRVIAARTTSGRLYDAGADRQRQMVALLGTDAAAQLGISSVTGAPAIFVGRSALTVVGIVGSVQQESQALLGVIVPPYVASVVGGRSGQRRVIARTAPGAAQLIGRQGPFALSPYQPGQVSAAVPPDPASLRAQVESSLSSLLGVLTVVGLAIGLLTITSVTSLSVSQRRAEIGLRRAIGYHRRDIARLILAEAACTGTIGGVAGASVGVLVTSVVAASRGWPPVIEWHVVGLAPLLGVVIGVAAGIYPARRATRVTPLQALRAG